MILKKEGKSFIGPNDHGAAWEFGQQLSLPFLTKLQLYEHLMLS